MHQRPARRLVALIVIGVLSLTALPACGEDDPAAVLDRAFKQPIGSANVALDLSLQVQGIPQLEQPARFQLRGPYRTGGQEKIPSFDWDLSLTAQGQTFTAGLVSTGDNAFVSFRGENYEFGTKQVAGVNENLAREAKEKEKEEGGLARFGIDPRRWLLDAKIDEDAKVAGVDTKRVTARVDVARLLEDLDKLAERQQRTAAAGRLTPEQRKQVADLIKDPRIDVYVGKDDDKIRRISTDLRLEVPEEQRQQARGAQSGTISFSLELADVGGDQKVTAPANARPIQDLAEQIRGLFGGGAGAGGAGGAGAGSQGADPGAGSGAAPGATGGATQEKLDQVRECLAQAGQDKQKQEACAAML